MSRPIRPPVSTCAAPLRILADIAAGGEAEAEAEAEVGIEADPEAASGVDRKSGRTGDVSTWNLTLIRSSGFMATVATMPAPMPATAWSYATLPKNAGGCSLGGEAGAGAIARRGEARRGRATRR